MTLHQIACNLQRYFVSWLHFSQVQMVQMGHFRQQQPWPRSVVAVVACCDASIKSQQLGPASCYSNAGRA